MKIAKIFSLKIKKVFPTFRNGTFEARNFPFKIFSFPIIKITSINSFIQNIFFVLEHFCLIPCVVSYSFSPEVGGSRKEVEGDAWKTETTENIFPFPSSKIYFPSSFQFSVADFRSFKLTRRRLSHPCSTHSSRENLCGKWMFSNKFPKRFFPYSTTWLHFLALNEHIIQFLTKLMTPNIQMEVRWREGNIFKIFSQ